MSDPDATSQNPGFAPLLRPRRLSDEVARQIAQQIEASILAPGTQLPTEDVGGVKYRVMQNPVFIEMFGSLGGNAMPMSWGEVYTAVQQGTIDGLEIPVAVVDSGNFTEVVRYLSLTQHTCSALGVLMFERAYNRLTEALALLLFTWIVLLTATCCTRENSHVRLGLLVDALPPMPRAIWQRLVAVLVLAFCLLLLISGWDYLARTTGRYSAAIRYPIEWLHAAAPVAGALGALHALVRLMRPEPDEVRI